MKKLMIVLLIWTVLFWGIVWLSSCKSNKVMIYDKVGYWMEDTIRVYGEPVDYNYKDSTYTMLTRDKWRMHIRDTQIIWLK